MNDGLLVGPAARGAFMGGPILAAVVAALETELSRSITSYYSNTEALTRRISS